MAIRFSHDGKVKASKRPGNASQKRALAIAKKKGKSKVISRAQAKNFNRP